MAPMISHWESCLHSREGRQEESFVATVPETLPSRHSAEYFANRIEVLKGQIAESLPRLDTPALIAFVDSCKSLTSSIDAKAKADDLLSTLQKQNADDEALRKAQALVDACQLTVTTVDQLVTDNGQNALADVDDVAKVNEAKLLECTILTQATPEGLANFCAGDPGKHGPIVDDFLADCDCMRQMIKHGGASNGNYGLAILIYWTLIEQIGTQTTEIRQKLALATALEHATPITVCGGDRDATINPFHRFWHYVYAYENGELDEAFESLTVWELRYVVDCDAPNDQLQWGRDYLKAYRPDQVLSQDPKWKYVWTVRTDLGYRHPDYQIETYMDMISAGGECGPRAFFGRFIAKAFGLPTWGVRQPGHAAMSRWTPQGWVVCLGAAFIFSWWDDLRYTGNNRSTRRDGVDFLEETQARANVCEETYYEHVCWLECIAETMGETVAQVVDPDRVWRSLSLVQRRLKAQTQGARERKHTQTVASTESIRDMANGPEEVHVAQDGRTIVIPAASFDSPAKPNKSVMVLPSFLGGRQLHLENDEIVGYTIPSLAQTGFYLLSARIVNVHRSQTPLFATVENSDDGETLVDIHRIEVQYTVGAWEYTKPIKVLLYPQATLVLSRETPCHGLSIKDITLEPC